MQIGDKVPEVLGHDQEGREVRMSDFAGRKVILYFYPKDSTPGCTAEACSGMCICGLIRKVFDVLLPLGSTFR